jgi:hypothetical protein
MATLVGGALDVKVCSYFIILTLVVFSCYQWNSESVILAASLCTYSYVLPPLQETGQSSTFSILIGQ